MRKGKRCTKEFKIEALLLGMHKGYIREVIITITITISNTYISILKLRKSLRYYKQLLCYFFKIN